MIYHAVFVFVCLILLSIMPTRLITTKTLSCFRLVCMGEKRAARSICWRMWSKHSTEAHFSENQCGVTCSPPLCFLQSPDHLGDSSAVAVTQVFHKYLSKCPALFISGTYVPLLISYAPSRLHPLPTL